MPQEPKKNVKALVATGAIFAMGGYIAGDEINEQDKLDQIEYPYEMAQELLEDALRKQTNWLREREMVESEISNYKITIDSLKRITNQFYKCLNDLEVAADSVKQCQEERYDYAKAYQKEENEVKIRDDQVDSLENVLDVYKNRPPIEKEFQAIHNCINAHSENMYAYQYEKQAECCIREIRKIQAQYPNNDLKDISFSCND